MTNPNPGRDRVREAEMLRMRDAGSSYAAIGRAFALSTGRISSLVERSKRERGDTDLPPTWREREEMARAKREKEEAELTDEQRAELRKAHAAALRSRTLPNFGRDLFLITGTQPPPCPLCNGTGLYDGEPCPDCTETDDGQPTEQEEWRDYDPDC